MYKTSDYTGIQTTQTACAHTPCPPTAMCHYTQRPSKAWFNTLATDVASMLKPSPRGGETGDMFTTAAQALQALTLLSLFVEPCSDGGVSQTSMRTDFNGWVRQKAVHSTASETRLFAGSHVHAATCGCILRNAKRVGGRAKNFAQIGS